jgi:hypothetical protein
MSRIPNTGFKSKHLKKRAEEKINMEISGFPAHWMINFWKRDDFSQSSHIVLLGQLAFPANHEVNKTQVNSKQLKK